MGQPKGLEPGVYPDLSMESYHNDPAIGSSGIKQLAISPEDYWIDSPLNPDREAFDTAAFKVGRAYHSMVLEPEKPFPFEIKKGVHTSKVEGMIGEGDYNMLERMYARLLRSPRAWNALHGGINEVSVFWRDQDTGLMLKCRPDSFAPKWVADLKTTTDVSNRFLPWEFKRRMYHVSGAHYSNGMQALKQMIREGYQMPDAFDAEFIAQFMACEKQMFAFVFQEKRAPQGAPSPFTVRCLTMTPYATEHGLEIITKGLAAYHDNQSNLAPWPSPFREVEDIVEGMVKGFNLDFYN